MICRWLLSLMRHMRAVNAELVELSERAALLNRPWEEDYLHWSPDGSGWQLHGWLVPPARRRRSVTGSGWCPALATSQIRRNGGPTRS